MVIVSAFSLFQLWWVSCVPVLNFCVAAVVYTDPVANVTTSPDPVAETNSLLFSLQGMTIAQVCLIISNVMITAGLEVFEFIFVSSIWSYCKTSLELTF